MSAWLHSAAMGEWDSRDKLYFSFEGNKTSIKQAIALIDAGRGEDAYRVLSDAHADLFPRTTATVTTHEGGHAVVSDHRDAEKYRTLDGIVVRNVVVPDPAGAKRELLSALEIFGWK